MSAIRDAATYLCTYVAGLRGRSPMDADGARQLKIWGPIAEAAELELKSGAELHQEIDQLHRRNSELRRHLVLVVMIADDLLEQKKKQGHALIEEDILQRWRGHVDDARKLVLP